MSTAVAVVLPTASRLRTRPLALAIATLVGATTLCGLVGAVSINPVDVVQDLAGVESGLTATEHAILWDIRLPRVVLCLLVGATLASSGAAFQGVFRNPLADPYLLGAAAGAGLGVTLVVINTSAGTSTPVGVPVAAFVGAMAAVVLTYALGAAGGVRASPAALVLAGVAVASFLTAIQTFLQQQHQDTLRRVYTWILGSTSTAGWHEVRILLPYAAVALTVLVVHRRVLDVLSVGDDEAAALGLPTRRVRLTVVAAASLGTAAAVSVSGLIGFVGIIVPHTVRLLVGSSYRVLLPLTILFGGAFLALADLFARTAVAPAEIPIGVVTAFFGAPFFIVVLRTSRQAVG